MPVPFRKVFERRGVRRFLLPFTMGLMLFGFVACTMVSS